MVDLFWESRLVFDKFVKHPPLRKRHNNNIKMIIDLVRLTYLVVINITLQRSMKEVHLFIEGIPVLIKGNSLSWICILVSSLFLYKEEVPLQTEGSKS